MQCLLNPGTTEFGAAPATAVIAVQTDATKTRQEIFNKLIVPMENALDGLPYKSIHVFCSDGYWSDLLENKQIRETYLNWEAAAALRGDPRQMVSFAGVTFERYRGTSAVKITDNEAVAFPTGVEGFGWMPFAPTDTMESVGAGAMGQPYYLGAKPIGDALGTKAMQIAIASHPKVVCGRPGAVLRIAKA
jgi:hypothetical protein